MGAKYTSLDLTISELCVLYRRHGSHQGMLNFLRGQEMVSEKNGARGSLVYFTVTTDGTTGPRWVERLAHGGARVDAGAKRALCSNEFRPTTGVTTEIVVLKGNLFKDEHRGIRYICGEAASGSLRRPNAEIACLIREAFSDQDLADMGLFSIVVMHEPIYDPTRRPRLLGASRDDGGHLLCTMLEDPNEALPFGTGFAFVVS